LGFTIGQQSLIDEFASIIGIQTQDRKGKERSCLLEGRKDSLWTLREEWETFGPASGNICKRQGIQGASLAVSTIVGDEIGFEKTRLSVVPPMEGTDGDLVFEQRSSLCRGKATRSERAMGAQEALSSGGAYPEEMASVLLRQLQISMPLQCCNERR